MGTAIALLIFAVILILFNLKAISKEKNSFKGTLSNAENNLEEFQVEIGKLRREFAETLLEIQTQLIDLEEKIETSNKNIDINNVIRNDLSISNKMKNTSTYKEIVNHNDKINDIIDINFKNVEKENKVDEENISRNIYEKENKNDIEETLNNNIKVREIQKLLDEGLSIDEVSDALKIGKGEVLLIKELYIR